MLIRAAIILSLLMTLSSCSQPEATIPASIYEAAVISERFDDDKARNKERKPAKILEFTGVAEGMTVIDLLGGGGWYTELLSYVVGDQGHVYIANSPLFTHFSGEALTKRLNGNRLNNVSRIDAPWSDLQLPENADIIWLVLGYHDIYVPRPNRPEFQAEPQVFYDQILKALKPGGKLLVIDHVAAEGTGTAHAASLHRIDKEYAKNTFTAKGLVFLAEYDGLRNAKDDYTQNIWAKKVLRKTDRFVYLFQKPTNNISK